MAKRMSKRAKIEESLRTGAIVSVEPIGKMKHGPLGNESPEPMTQVPEAAEVQISPADVQAAAREITDLTGGSSGMGRWSYLWGFLLRDWEGGRSLPHASAIRARGSVARSIAAEAADFQSLYRGELTETANKLLSVLASGHVPGLQREGTSLDVRKGKGRRSGLRQKTD